MQFNFTENQLVTLLGTIAAGIAAVAGRYIWRWINAAENGGIAVGWGTAVLAVCTAGFGATNWNDLAQRADYPAVTSQDNDATTRAKISAFEARKEEVAKAHAAALVPITVAVPMTLLAPLLGFMAFIKLNSSYTQKWTLDQEREIARQDRKQMKELAVKVDHIAAMRCDSACGPTKTDMREASSTKSSSPKPMSPGMMSGCDYPDCTTCKRVPISR